MACGVVERTFTVAAHVSQGRIKYTDGQSPYGDRENLFLRYKGSSKKLVVASYGEAIPSGLPYPGTLAVPNWSHKTCRGCPILVHASALPGPPQAWPGGIKGHPSDHRAVQQG